MYIQFSIHNRTGYSMACGNCTVAFIKGKKDVVQALVGLALEKKTKHTHTHMKKCSEFNGRMIVRIKTNIYY